MAEATEENKSAETFEYQSDFDTNGICYYLGTERRTNEWTNPAILGSVRVEASSLGENCASPWAVVGRTCVRCVTQPLTDSFVVIDFTPHAIKPTAYTLKHYSSFDKECLRNWRLEGSNDKLSWVTISEHENDETLNAVGATGTWPLQPPADESYCVFRITQTGLNSNNHYFLALSGFEIYGELFMTDAPATESAVVTVDARSQPLPDAEQMPEGIIHRMGTAGDTREWQNPCEDGLVEVTSSSVGSDSEPLSVIVGKTVARFVTNADENQWIAIDLKGTSVRPTMYALRHYSSWDTEALRNWDLQGSNDGENWEVISSHVGDEGLFGKGSVKTWTVECGQFYSRFRVIMTGTNSNEHWYLALSGFEIFGDVAGVDERAGAEGPE